MVKFHHLYHSSHSYRQSKHILKSQFVCWRVCPGWFKLLGFGRGRSDPISASPANCTVPTRREFAPPVFSKCYKWPKRGIETKHFAKFWRIRGMTFPYFFSHTGVKLYQFSKDLKGGQNCRIFQWPSYSEYPPRGCLSIFWKGYWVYGVLFLEPRVLYRNLSVVWIWKLSVLAMWCKLVKTFRSERSP